MQRLPFPCSRAGIGAVALALASVGAQAADAEGSVKEQLKRLVDRLQALEQRNQELERKLERLQAAQPAAPAPAAGAAAVPAGEAQMGQRLQAIEEEQKSLAQQLQGLSRPGEEADPPSDGGPKIFGTLTTVVQRVNAGGGADAAGRSRLNYRGDLAVELPVGAIGDAQGMLVGHLRFGQGGGVALRPTYTSTPNTTTFEATAGSEDTYAIVAEAYYRLDVPLDGGRFNDQKGNRLALAVGKIDFFTQFDQNAVAADEAAQFLNNAFVHNPLLDSGGDIGADSFGFAPGLRAGYFSEGESMGWGLSFGAFASGEGARYNGSLGKPLYIAQFELYPKQINGEPRGNYRVYAWSNGRTTDFDGNPQRHAGFGLSVDQKVGREWNLFGRYGQRTSGSGPFDRALTAGFEHGGRLWGRNRDAIGVAYGLLDTGRDWRGLTADGSLVGYAASGRERIVELFYRFKLNDHVELTPDLQWIRRPAGDGSAPGISVIGLRGTVGF